MENKMKLNRIHLEKYTNLNESTIDEILQALSVRDTIMEEFSFAKTPAAALTMILHERKRGKEAKEKLDKLDEINWEELFNFKSDDIPVKDYFHKEWEIICETLSGKTK